MKQEAWILGVATTQYAAQEVPCSGDAGREDRCAREDAAVAELDEHVLAPHLVVAVSPGNLIIRSAMARKELVAPGYCGSLATAI